MSDRIFGAIGLLLSVFFIWQATYIQESFFSDIVGQKVFPIIIGCVLGLSSIAFILRPDDEPRWPTATKLFEIAMAVAVMVAYALLLPEIGFLVATVLATAFLSWRLGSTLVQSSIAGVLTALAIYIIFNKILGLSLADGPLDGIVDAVVDPIGSAISSVFSSVQGILLGTEEV